MNMTRMLLPETSNERYPGQETEETKRPGSQVTHESRTGSQAIPFRGTKRTAVPETSTINQAKLRRQQLGVDGTFSGVPASRSTSTAHLAPTSLIVVLKEHFKLQR